MAVTEVQAGSGSLLGMSNSRFLREFWQKRPLLVRQALPGFEPPLTPEDLAGLACEDAALSRLVTHQRRQDRWTLRSGPFREDEFPDLGCKDWTLLVQDMDKWDMDVRALLGHFRFLPAWRLDDVMISYATPGGSVGPHVDQYDVFLLQALGHRRWQVDADPDAPRGFRPDVELKLLERFSASDEWVLEPGDLLYLPPGVPHHGEAVDACMTFSIGMRAPSRAELIVDLAEEVAAGLPEESRYADPDLQEPQDPFEIDASALARVDRALAALHELSPEQRRDWFGRFITRYRASGEIGPGPRLPTPAVVDRELAAGGKLLAHPFSRCAWSASAQPGRALLFVNGHSLPMSLHAARRLAASAELDASAVSSLGEDDRAALDALIAQGHYQLQRAARKRK